LTKSNKGYIIRTVKQKRFTVFIFQGVLFLQEIGIETVILLDTYEKLLTETQASILRMRFDEDLSLSEIGEILNISRQAARNAIIKGEEKLRFYEETLKIVARDQKIKAIINEIEQIPEAREYAIKLREVTEEV
jgi:predicted DNA-binding protein YlxM (UPF0122 family)